MVVGRKGGQWEQRLTGRPKTYDRLTIGEETTYSYFYGFTGSSWPERQARMSHNFYSNCGISKCALEILSPKNVYHPKYLYS